MAFDEALAARIRALLADRKGITEKKMFGGIAFLLGGRMCCGVLDSDLVPAYIGQLNKEEPFAGRSITELRLTAKTGKATSGPARYVEFSLSIPLRKDAS